MPGQTIGTVNVQVGNQGGRVNTINYGLRSLKGSTDLAMAGAKTGDVIVYQANTNSFVIEPVAAIVPSLDAGEF
jgi:predicted transcriptional regulator